LIIRFNITLLDNIPYIIDHKYAATDYILFVGQEANFQSRSILIPAQDFIEVRREDYELLKKSSIKNYTFNIKGKSFVIDNLLIQNYNFEGNIGHQEQKEYTDICNKLTHYADGLDEDHYFDLKDKTWYDASICGICRGFNDIENYSIWKNATKYEDKEINIIDSFLCLELTNGKLNLPIFDTVEEMLLKMYNYVK
jgi:hypothetical protein